ncbi:hypothetical protein D0867_08320 [Hortaea werneckii]|uniref:Diphthamide biosynthesis protein 4 n=1 Tax=Hortaea werneckii TaxID=91943 RepID=A0A3M6Z5K6_HORWE|nr:hypothetical protein D0867_08320 [Hortaea werneckii]RMY27677.1 hypothetical protein D0866_09975 [Hortaea werneckii]
MSNHYERLGLASRPRDGTLSAEAIKQAYRQALLSHHPDKLRERQKKDANRPALSVDQITFAYKVLSDPELRAEYDLALLHEASNDPEHGRVHQTGLETVDLDALEFQDESETWTRSCRCGDPKGFVVSEPELEKHIDEGELTVGCRGCSLWLRVLFSVED